MIPTPFNRLRGNLFKYGRRWKHDRKVRLWRKRNTQRTAKALKEQGLSTNVYEWPEGRT